ncbi:N-formylglutamate amidohydrolase [Psychromarinibacter sp. C21-152]|uniref:N-formylglutamate amidohydrolase n=1 Tax=Psychromarinibacter sediminicola TaxID=3033385 RepID=A0AAE3NUT0_9RHOB|nr:N-formylglutamate amidohydrolase [Psychromarinibacter sediminicola]MDF0602676.1 N-formylglutamate amidohydrolase [Psychromarinibacter sediminicola]
MGFQAYETVGETRPGRWLVTCDHASNAVPPMIAGGDLGLPPREMGRHIAYDIGAAGVSRRLAERLDCPAVLSTFSRLVIDPNRGEDDPTLLMQLYDGTVIPGNRRIDAAERERRLTLCYRPYHAEVERLAARRDDTVYIAVHSFTPRLNGRAMRPWQVGVLYGYDARFGKALIERLREEPDLFVGENEPYSGELKGDSVDRHALHRGRPNALIEIRHDLIETEEQQRHWADRLAPILDQTLARTQL